VSPVISSGLSVVQAALDLRIGRMHFKPPPAGDSNRHLHRTALMPYCGEVSSSANVDCIGELVEGLRLGWLRSPQNVNASPLPCNRAGTSPLRALVAKAPKALRYASQKNRNSESFPHRSCRGPPALATATHGPTGIVPFGPAGDESSPRRGCIGTAAYHSNLIPLMMCPRTSTRFLIIPARAQPSLGGTRFARSDTIRTPLLFLSETLLDCSLKPDS
jgi:hypothetical protein